MIHELILHLDHTILNANFFSYLIQSILICSLTMSLIAAGALLITRILREKQSAAGRCLLWWVIGFGYLIPFKPHPAGALTVIRAWDYSDTAALTDGTCSQLNARLYPATDFFLLLLIIWVIGAIVFGTVTLNRQEQFSRSISRLRMPADAATQILADRLCNQLGMTQNVPVYTVRGLDTPMLTGLLHPCILLPEHAYEPAELRLMLKHELCHDRRGDLWCKLLWVCCRTIHWFNPLLILLMRQIEQDCELACDDAVMKHETADAANIYCNSILHTAMRRSAAYSGTMLATGLSGSREMLMTRFRSILSGGKKRLFPTISAAALVLTAMTGSILAYKTINRTNAPHAEVFPETEIYTTMSYAPAASPETYTVPNVTLPFPENMPAQTVPPVTEPPYAGTTDGILYTVPQAQPIP